MFQALPSIDLFIEGKHVVQV